MNRRYQRAYVEITNVCNLRCGFCAPPVRPAAFMEPDFFASVLEQLRPLTGEICLHVLGEPLGHPQFPVFPAICDQSWMSLNLTTNATLLPLHRQNILNAPALRQINFSLHSLLQGKEPDFSILEHVLAFCTEAMEKRPDLYVNLRLWNLDSLTFPRENALSGRLLERVAEYFGADVRVPPGRKSRRLRGRVYLHRDTRFSWPGSATIPERERGCCHGLNTHFAILADGTVCPCCLDAGGRLALGNVRHADLEEILDGPRAAAMREGFAQGRLVEKQCRTCSYCRRFRTPRH